VSPRRPKKRPDTAPKCVTATGRLSSGLCNTLKMIDSQLVFLLRLNFWLPEYVRLRRLGVGHEEASAQAEELAA
jgi:hypothetical protein